MAFNRLIGEVTDRDLTPYDHYEVAAILESLGWTDQLARETFGVENIFTLAQDIWHVLAKDIQTQALTAVEKISFLGYAIMIVRSFIRGSIFALPMAISVIAMLTLRFSLWSYEYLSLELATSIAIGTILSFMAIGGFTQAIARRGFSYITQGYYNMARRMTFHFVKLGYLFCFIIAILMMVICAFFGIFSPKMLGVIVLYFFFLSSIWLAVTVLYLLERQFTFTLLMSFGIFIVFIFFKVLQWNIIFSQLIALTIVSVLAILFAIYYFIQAERKMEKGIAPALPRFSIVIYTVMPYFAYGFLYFTMLFIDRVMAWSTNNIYMPYIIWFRGPYELGLDFALLALIIPMGVVEVVVNEFMVNLVANQKNHMLTTVCKLNKAYLKMYYRRVIFVAVFSLLNALVVYLAIKYIDVHYYAYLHTHLLANGETQFVFIWAVIAYAILVVGLMNAVILFSFSQPEMVTHAILYALLCNMLIGFLLSRWVNYSWAVFGLLCGSILFTVISSYNLIRVLRNLDYYLYAQA